MKRFELSTLSLARRCSTTELHPHLHEGEPPHLFSMQYEGPIGQVGGGGGDQRGKRKTFGVSERQWADRTNWGQGRMGEEACKQGKRH